ncbi:MAG: IclR family transcriptional regulator [Methylibium sp.]|uniref:IclR family transcriptional regulator n=1 Tax=Methylibium sp. TaxID=2067992 RepID=UPI0017BA00A0|nr:IclR family transcriptional regulator [Methylibium sp.]MBA3599367.1 IclR family transcriptional regulator [Methylibium sp.]
MDATFAKGLQALEALAANPNLTGVTDLARHLGLTKSNAHRLLQTLVGCGYVRNVEQSGKYELTLKLWELGAAVVGRLDLKTISTEYMERLCQLSGETVHLSVLDGMEVIYLDKVDSPHPVRSYSRVGGRAPAYCVATGKALLGYASPALIDAISLELKPFTPYTVTTPNELRSELEKLRQVGYAVNRGEWRDGVCGIASPIWNAGGHVCAAIGLSGPADRFKARNLRQLAPSVVSVAQQISARLGYRPQEVGATGAELAAKAA